MRVAHLATNVPVNPREGRLPNTGVLRWNAQDVLSNYRLPGYVGNHAFQISNAQVLLVTERNRTPKYEDCNTALQLIYLYNRQVLVGDHFTVAMVILLRDLGLIGEHLSLCALL
jgi:hypothetical protein